MVVTMMSSVPSKVKPKTKPPRALTSSTLDIVIACSSSADAGGTKTNV